MTISNQQQEPGPLQPKRPRKGSGAPAAVAAKNLESVSELHNLLFFSSFNFLSNSMYDVLPFSRFHQTIENYNVMLKRFGNARKILESLNELYILLFFSCFNFLSNSIYLCVALFPFSSTIENCKVLLRCTALA